MRPGGLSREHPDVPLTPKALSDRDRYGFHLWFASASRTAGARRRGIGPNGCSTAQTWKTSHRLWRPAHDYKPGERSVVYTASGSTRRWLALNYALTHHGLAAGPDRGVDVGGKLYDVAAVFECELAQNFKACPSTWPEVHYAPRGNRDARVGRSRGGRLPRHERAFLLR